MTRIPDLPLNTYPAPDDLLVTHDVSDATDGADGTSKHAPISSVVRVLNVKQFGAVGNGNNDDTQAFKDAIAELGIWTTTGSTENLSVGSYGGGEIFIPIGDYQITDTLLYSTGITFRGEGKGTILRFSPGSAIPLFQMDPAGDFKGTQGANYVRWLDMSIIGDRNIVTLAGNCTVGIDLGNVTYAKIKDCRMNGWDIAVQANNGNPASSYYAKVEDCLFIYNRRAIIAGADAAVFQVVDSIFIKQVATTATVDYQIEHENTFYIVGGALEGGTIGIAHVKSKQGRLFIHGCHIDAGGSVVELKHDTLAGSVSMMNPLTEGSSIVHRDMFTDPATWPTGGWDQDTTSRGYIQDNGGGNFVARIKNCDFRYGLENWSISPAEGYLTYLTDRADLFGFISGVKVTKTSTSNHMLVRQFFGEYVGEGECYITCLVQRSDDSIMNMGFIGPQGTAKLKPVSTFGDPSAETRWELWVGWLPYYKRSAYASNEIYTALGLATASPIDSWCKLTGVQIYTGGYPILPCKKDMHETVAAKPTQGHPLVGERIYDEAPAVGNPQGWVCTKRSDTTLSANALGSQAVIAVVDSTGWAIGDTVGVDLNTGEQHWSTIASLGPITLNDNLPSAADSGNKVTNHLFVAMPNL